MLSDILKQNRHLVMHKINFNEDRTIGEVIHSSVQFLKEEGIALLKLYFKFLFPLFILLAFLTYRSDLLEVSQIINLETDFTDLENLFNGINLKSIWLVGIIQAFIWLIFLTVTLIYVKNYHLHSQKTSFREMWGQLLYEFPKVFILQFFYLSMIFFGIVSFVIPGIYFGVSFALATTILVFQDTRVFQAMHLSLRLTIKKWFKTLGYLFIFYLVYLVVRILLQLPFSMIMNQLIENQENLNRFAFTTLNIFNSVINILSSIFPILGTVYLYFILSQSTPLPHLEESNTRS